MLERLKAGGEGDDRGPEGWKAFLTQWTWVWANSGRWWKTGEPGVLQSVASQRVGHNLVTKQNTAQHKGTLPRPTQDGLESLHTYMKDALHRQSLTLTTFQSLYHLIEKTLAYKECNPVFFHICYNILCRFMLILSRKWNEDNYPRESIIN